MTHRQGSNPFKDVNSDDKFLTALSEGRDLSRGEDYIAGLLLDFRDDVTRPVEQPFFFDAPRPRWSRFRDHFQVALVGAAAASVVVIGSATALNRVPETSPMWGLAAQVFPQKAQQKELSDTIVDINQKLVSGDVEQAGEIAAEAQAQIRGVDIHAPVPTASGDSPAIPPAVPWGTSPAPEMASTAAVKPATPAPASQENIQEPSSVTPGAEASASVSVPADAAPTETLLPTESETPSPTLEQDIEREPQAVDTETLSTSPTSDAPVTPGGEVQPTP